MSEQKITILNNIFLFDVDGTLTPPRQKMTKGFYSFFREWIRDKQIYLVSGSDFEKIQEQIPADVLMSISGIFGCMGNTYHIRGENVFKNTFIPSVELQAFLEKSLESSSWTSLCGNHIEKRVGMINFSVVGRNASQEERIAYHKWDSQASERQTIADFINENFEGIEAVVGGEISIDIFPTGADKSQVLKHIPQGRFHFFGDKTDFGGNDHALAKKLDNGKDLVYSVSSYKDTEKVLRKL